jgi:hypothetical protein
MRLSWQMTGTNIAPGRSPRVAPAAAGPPAWAGRLRRWFGTIPRAVYIHLAVLIGYLAAGIAVNWTRALYLIHHQLPWSRDTGLYVWDFWWMARSVSHLTSPFYSYFQAAPVGVPLAYHTMMPLPGALMTPITRIYGAAFTLNLLAALAPGLTAYAMYRVARLWLPTQTGAIAAGAFFGLSTIVTWNDWLEAQLMLGQIFLPIALEAAIRLGRRPNWRQAVILGVVMGAALLTDQESAILAGLLAVLALVPWLARVPSRGGDPLLVKARAAVISVAVFVLIGSPQLLAMYQQGKAGDVTVNSSVLASDINHSGATLQQIFAPSPRVGFFGLTGLQHYYYSTGPPSATMVAYGVVVTALALLGLAVCWRRPGSRRLALLWIGATLLALGTTLQISTTARFVPLAEMWHGIRVSMIMPYTWLVRIPAFSSFREANRITELGMIPAALLAAAGVDWLRRKVAPAALLALVLAAFEMGSVGATAIAPVTMPTGMSALDAPIRADHSGSIVVDIPVGVRSAVPQPGQGAQFNPEAQVVATGDGHPRTIAYVSRMSVSYVNRIRAHPFYNYLLELQDHDSAAVNNALFGRHNRGSAELTAARLDARRMNVGWAIMWNPQQVYRRYLTAVGFRFAYRADGIPVYRLPHTGPGASGSGGSGSGSGG